MPALGREREREGRRDGGTEGGTEAQAFGWVVDPCVARLHELAGGLVAARRRPGARQRLGERDRERARDLH